MRKHKSLTDSWCITKVPIKGDYISSFLCIWCSKYSGKDIYMQCLKRHILFFHCLILNQTKPCLFLESQSYKIFLFAKYQSSGFFGENCLMFLLKLHNMLNCNINMCNIAVARDCLHAIFGRLRYCKSYIQALGWTFTVHTWLKALVTSVIEMKENRKENMSKGQ